MAREENQDMEVMDKIQVDMQEHTSSERTMPYPRQGDAISVKNESINNRVFREILIENDVNKTNENKRNLSHVPSETTMNPRDRTISIVQAGGKDIGEIDINHAQNGTTNNTNSSFIREKNVDNTRNADINKVLLKHEANSTVNFEQNYNVSKLREKLFKFYESKNNYGDLLQATILHLQNYSLNDKYSNTSDYNSLSEDISRETERFKVASLTPIQGFGREVLIYSAILGNSSHNTTWDRLAIQGWEMLNLTNQSYFCCVVYKSGIIRVTQVSVKISRFFKVELTAKQFICDVSHLNDLQKELPVFVTLIAAVAPSRCPTVGNLYARVEYAYQHPGEFVIFAKVSILN